MATKTEKVVEIRRPVFKSTEITIVGDSPLLVHRWSEKAKKEMLASMQKEGRGMEVIFIVALALAPMAVVTAVCFVMWYTGGQM